MNVVIYLISVCFERVHKLDQICLICIELYIFSMIYDVSKFGSYQRENIDLYLIIICS